MDESNCDFRDPSLMGDFVSKFGISEHASGVALPAPVKFTEDILREQEAVPDC